MKRAQFQSGRGYSGGDFGPNIRFKSDGAKWGSGGEENIWLINKDETIDLQDRCNNISPAIRVIIDEHGNVAIFGKRTTDSSLGELETINPTTGNPRAFNTLHWLNDETNP